MQKQKILFLITKSNWGGAQRYVFDLATLLPTDEYEITVALGGSGELKDKLQQSSIRVISIDGLQRDISFKKEFIASRAIYSIIKTEQPDVLHINSSKAGLFGALLGRIAGVPRIVFTAHGWAFNEDRPLPVRLVLKYFHWLTVLFTHRTIAVSHALMQQMNWPLMQSKMSVIHNGRAVPDFISKEDARAYLIEIEPKLAAHQEDFWTGTIAELHPVKGHDVMIEAVAKLVTCGHQLRHVIIGDGDERENLEELIKEKNLTDHVFLIGHIHEASRYLKAFDIFTLTSRSEALGYTIIEAAQANLPIVASYVGGIPEIISNNENGLLVDTGNTKMLSEALQKLIDNPTLRADLAKKAKEKSHNFSIKSMVQKTMCEY